MVGVLLLLLLPLLSGALGAGNTTLSTSTPEPAQAIDKINISAFVSDFSDASVENTSEVWTESLDVGPKDSVPVPVDEGVDVTFLSDSLVDVEDVGAKDSDEALQPFAGSRGLVSNFRVTLLVENLAEGREYTVEETHNSEEEVSQITVQDPLRNATSTCTLHTNGFGFATTGVRCRTSRNLPHECFCWDGICSHPYYPLSRLLAPLARATLRPRGNTLIWTFPDPQGPPVGDNPDRLTISASLRLVSGSWLLPLELTIRGAAYSLGAHTTQGEKEWARLRYTVLQFRPLTPSSLLPSTSTPGRLPAPSPGIYCPRSSTHLDTPLPALPSQFSVQIESQEREGLRVSYAHHHYHLPHRLVSMQVSPRPHHYSSSLFLSSLSLSPGGLPPHTYNIIHDFNSGLQYTVSQHSGNCTVQAIPRLSPDLAVVDRSSVRLRLAREMLDISPDRFVYTGQRYVRGILADIWTGEKLGDRPDDPYSTVELFFSAPSYTVQVGEVNEERQVPLGMATYHAETRTSSYFKSTSLSHYFHFSTAEPRWSVFDISRCVPRSKDRLYLKISLTVGYAQLVQYSLAAAQDSLRAELARQAGVSPLRVVDLFISSSGGETRGVDVWFVLLQKPQLSRDPEDDPPDSWEGVARAKAAVAPSLSQAHTTMQAALRTDRQLRLVLGPSSRVLLVRTVGGSLASVGEALHPASRARSYLFLRASYTAGSMAGLGFSMAVLGLSLGILVGFLLWKRRLGLPYYVG